MKMLTLKTDIRLLKSCFSAGLKRGGKDPTSAFYKESILPITVPEPLGAAYCSRSEKY